MSGAHLFTPGRHFNKQRIQQGAQMQSINQADTLFEFQTYKISGLFWRVFVNSLLKYVHYLPAVGSSIKYKRLHFTQVGDLRPFHFMIK